MLKIEDTKVYGIDTAVKRALVQDPRRISDSSYDTNGNFVIGNDDYKLMKTYVTKRGYSWTDRSAFLRMIIVNTEVTAPQYWWEWYFAYMNREAIPSVALIQPRICNTYERKHFSMEDLEKPISIHINGTSEEEEKKYIDNIIDDTIHMLNVFSEENASNMKYTFYRENKLSNDKAMERRIEQLMPGSKNATYAIQLDYAALRKLYHIYKNTDSNEWQVFCQWIQSLPYSELITE